MVWCLRLIRVVKVVMRVSNSFLEGCWSSLGVLWARSWAICFSRSSCCVGGWVVVGRFVRRLL